MCSNNLRYNLQVRKCYNVEELLCGLVETVKYEIIQARQTIQKCYPVKERVCDTVYESQLNQVDDYQVCTLINTISQPPLEFSTDLKFRQTASNVKNGIA